MPYRPPLVAHENFVADPPDLPIRRPGESGLSTLVRADVVATDPQGVTLKAATSGGETLAVQVGVAGEGIIRVRLSQDTDARTRSAKAIALVHPGSYAGAQVNVDGGVVRVNAGSAVAEITLDPWHLRFVDRAGRTLLAENGGEYDISGRMRTLPFGRSSVDGAVVAYHESFTARADERFVGLGEKFTPLDKRSQRALMWNFDAFGSESERSYKNIPMYLSSRGYGLLVDSGMPVEFDICQSTHSCVQILVPDDLIDYYLLAGPTPAEVLNRYNQLTSRPLLPPKWAFGTWISSGFYVDTQEKVLERAMRLRDGGIPSDVLHLDCYWQVAGHWSDLRWDTVNFPDPSAMLATLTEQGFKVGLWLNPYLSHLSPAFPDAAAAGHLLRRPDGSVYVADVWHGTHPPCGIIDFTNPETVAWYSGILRSLLEQGISVFKTDFAEGVPADAVAANGMTGVQLHNVYTLLFNDLVSRVTQEVAGHGMVWARSSYLGGQRHAAQWSGDVNASYPAMASNLRGGLSHGLAGVPFWSHDVGGFTGTPTPDLYARWAQFGALSPLIRFHGTTSRLPWEFPEFAAEIAVEALRLRYRLMPYIYSAAVDSARTGVPMMRALLVDSPDDPAAWNAELEYLLGPDLLVAPMVDPDGSRQVYVPPGDWVDYWTGTVHSGRRYRRVSKPLDQIPLFVRYGALIPVVPPADTLNDTPFADVTVVSWGAVDGRTVIRDTDGDTVVSAARSGDRFEVTVEGPKPIRRIAFPVVEGTALPREVLISSTPAVVSTVDGQLTAELP
jgi:alpha-D-xyloside xylohydrolase